MITTLLTRGAVIAVPAPSSSARQAGSGPSEKNIPAAGPGSGSAEHTLVPKPFIRLEASRHHCRLRRCFF